MSQETYFFAETKCQHTCQWFASEQGMDNYKEYSSLKNLNCSNWNAYGMSEQECASTSGKWHSCSSMDATSNYQAPSSSSCYYIQSVALSGNIKTEYEPLYEPANGDCFNAAPVAQSFKYSYLEQGDPRALLSPAVHCHQSSSATSQQQSNSQVVCPPDSTFNSSDSGSSDISKTVNRSTHSSRPSKGKADKHHQKSQHCNSSSGEDGSRKVILRPHSTPATLMWLENNYELADGVCIPRSVLYLHYVDFCSINRVQPVNAASFGKIIRQQFPHLTTRRLGTRGQSRYHYYGIGIKENSAYYQLSYSKKSIQIHSITESTSKSLKGGSSLYAKQHQNQMSKMQGKMMGVAKIGSLEDVNSKMINHANSTSICYNDGRVLEQSGCHQEMSIAQNGQLYGNFSTSSSKHYKVDRFDICEGSTLVDQFGQLSTTGASKMSPSGSLVSSFVPSLPPFPTAEELELCNNGGHNNLVSTFLLMYRAHCQRILDAIVRANFEELNTLVFHFWQKIPHHLAPVLSSLLLINLLGICDIRLYRTIIKLISVTLGQPLTDLAYTQLENFVSNLDSVLGTALHKENALLQKVKLELARHFGGIVKCLLRHSRVYHSVQGQSSSANCQTALKQLYLDWSCLDLSALCDHLVQQYGRMCRGSLSEQNAAQHNACLRRVHQILYQHCAEFKIFLATFTDYSQLFEWFESVWQVSLQWYHSCVSASQDTSRKSGTHFGLEFARYFIVLWTCARLCIGQELSRIKAPSGNLFNTLSALFDDFCVYKVKDLYFDDCTSMLFANAAQNAMPTLPQYFEPLDLMKQTSSFLEAYETSSNACGEQQWPSSGHQSRGSGASGSYHEMYSNLHSNALWLSYSGQQQQKEGSTSSHYPETSEQYSNNDRQPQNCNFSASEGGQHVEYVGGVATEQQYQHQSRSQRPESLICFSMNFHANSIQVMTTPTTTAVVPSAHHVHRGEVAVVTEQDTASSYVSSSDSSGQQFSKCYHSPSDDSQNVDATLSNASSSNARSTSTSNLYTL